nr:PREDICTED: uncharacterized protein LOC103313398 isoform X2 [Tribolium castaneum]|eukprot:XP_008194761.1 PREDICTED: uncharacterized protein LOC103313398 isoform X2 [Tribolium castaneum]
MADDEYNRKLESLQQYIPFLNNMIVQLKDPRKKNREQQLTKMMSLHSMITDKKKKLKLETLIKCEDVILKLYDKVKSGSSQSNFHSGPPAAPVSLPSIATTSKCSPITPSSPSPPRDIPKTQPVVIPTEKIPDRKSTLSHSDSSSSYYKPKIDIYSSAGDSLKSNRSEKASVFERLGKKRPDMSKPPISYADLEALQDDAVDTERLSLNELNDLREKLQKQLKASDESNNSFPINTTVRNTTILTKKSVEKSVSSDKVKPVDVKAVVKPVTSPAPKPVKVIKEAASMFGNTLSSIDNQILEGSKHKERRNSTSNKKESERRNSNEKKPESSSHKKTDRKSSTEHKHKDETKSSKKEEKDKDDKPKTEPVYKRLADKYNPKPRKPQLAPKPEPVSPPKETPPPDKTLSKPPITPPILPNLPLASPTSSTHSADSEITSFNKKPISIPVFNPNLPPPLPNFVPNPNNPTFVSQFKPRPNFPPNQPQFAPQFPPTYWPNQPPASFPPRPFTALPNQFEQMPPNFPPPTNTYTPQENLFGRKDRDMRPRDDWRPSRPRETNRDPRINQRTFDQRPTTPRRESKEYEHESRSKFRDPRLNRTRYDNEQDRSRSRSQESEESSSSNTFASPLDSLYGSSDSYRKTGKGYGVQNFKIPKIKREEEPELDEPKASTSEAYEEKKEENVASSSVSSSTECDKTNESQTEETSAEVGEISSTNDVQESQSREESKPEDQTEIINKFLKKLLENERTRAAASMFIDTVSSSLDDEKLKMVVQKVKAVTEEEEKRELIRRRMKLKSAKLKAQLLKKKQAVQRKMRLKRERLAKLRKNEEEEQEELEKEEKVKEKKEEVLVSVGERIKNRKRVAASSTPKKKKSKHKTELDLLHEDIQDMFIRDGVLTATGKRMCRLLKNDEAKTPPQLETTPRSRRTRSFAEKIDSEKLKEMSNVRVLIPKISVEKLEVDDDGQRYSLRRSNKTTKSYVEEDSDEEKEKPTKEEEPEEEKKESSDEEEEEEEPPVEKLPETPKRIRKRAKSWASGIIPKQKRKKIVVADKEEPDDNEEQEEDKELDKSTEFIEPDKNYFTANSWHFRSPCKLCSYYGKNITKHYRSKHPDSEVLSSRLRPDKAEKAIKVATELKLDESEDVALASTRQYSFKCRFCDVEMNSKPTNFFDHVTTHTGEYRYLCTLCHFSGSNMKPLKSHYEKVHKKNFYPKVPWIKTRIYGYICLECNFVQMNRKTVENHINVYHLEEGCKIMKIHLSIYDDSNLKRSITMMKKREAIIEEPLEEKIEEPEPKRMKTPVRESPEPEPKRTKTPVAICEPVIKKEKEIDMTVFTCKTDIDEENEKIEQERLRKMAELNETVKTNRQSLNFVEQLSNRLLQEEKEAPESEIVCIKTEPLDIEPEPEPEPLPEITSKKPLKLIEPPVTTSLDVVQKDNTMIQGMIEKLQVKLKDGTSVEGPPPLTPLVEKKLDDAICVISAGFLNIAKHDDGLEYICRVPSCLFSTKLRDSFITHLDEDHTRIHETYKTTKCKICQVEITSTVDTPLLREFFTHVESKHLDSEKDSLTPILRTRRLSGDQLSKKEEEDGEQEEENPWGIKIAEVKSLADESTTIPPLSPIKERQSTKIESVVLKETKLTPVEKETKWKSNEALAKFLQCPRSLYKCPQFFCKFATSLRPVFDNHIKIHSPAKEHLMNCVYCDVKTPLTQASLHIDLRHSNCLYSCSQCLYRALMCQYVMVHLKLRHPNDDRIIALSPKQAKTIMMSKQKKFSAQESCPPYTCGYEDCNSQFLYINEYYNHVTSCHKGLMACGSLNTDGSKCGYTCASIDSLIDHARTHNCYPLHCLLCKSGCVELYSMLEHYSLIHPNMSPEVVDRRNSPKDPRMGHIYHYTDEAFTKIRCIPSADLLSTIVTKGFNVVPVDAPEPSPKPSTPEPKNVTLVPLSLIQPKTPETSGKIIAIFPKSNDPVKIFSPTSTPPKPKPDNDFVFASSEKDDPIRVDEGENSTDPLSLENDSQVMVSGDESDSQETNEANETKSYGLIGYQLFRCGFCDISFSNARDFRTHCINSKKCRDDSTNKPFKCVHCDRMFKHPNGLLEHIQYHGQLRFCCSLCVRRFPSSFSLKLHMRGKHNVTNTITTPIIPNKTNLERDEFVLRPVPLVEPSDGQNTTKEPAYGPDEIDKLPKRCIFNSEIKCALCAYSTKVRSNLVRHLQFHSAEKSVPETAPVNPVPCLEKNEKMFDKMTNLAISSFTGRMGGPKSETKVEVPAYVPAHRRYVCCAPNCNYLCLEESNLRHHLFALHVQEASYTCAHCKTNLKTDIEGYLKHLKLHDLHLYKCSNCSFVHNLRHKVDKHAGDKHPEKTTNTITVRALEAELVEGDQSPAPTGVANVKWTKPWHCGMCKYRCAAKDDIVTHIFNKHDINTQFKCTLCSYKTNEKKTFGDHFKDNHPDNDIDIIYVYYKSEGAGQGASTSGQKQFDTTPLWQRDRPRVRHIRGILFEETPQKGKKPITVRQPVATPSTSGTSNLDLAIEAVATGTDEYTSDKIEEIKEEPVILVDDDDEVEETGGEVDMCGELLIDVEKVPAVEEKEYLNEEKLTRKYGALCQPLNKAFKCPICFKFKTKKISYFVYHVLGELKCQRFKCKSCDFVCLTMDTMLSHCQELHDNIVANNVIDLPIDKTIEYWLQILIKHQAKALIQGANLPTGEENTSAAFKTQCLYCPRWFRNMYMCKEHELLHWADHTYVCSHCYSEHGTLDDIFQHNFLLHPDCEPSIATKNGPFVTKVISNLKSPPVGLLQGGGTTDEVLYSCIYCSEIEKSLQTLRKHVTECHEGSKFCYKVVTKSKVEVMYCCTYCHERGSDTYLKQHHTDKHEGLKFNIYQYICLECSGTYLNIKDLRKHFGDVHQGKKLTYSCVESKQGDAKDQFCCTKCPFRSCSVGGIRSHVRKHLRPIDCLLCGASFIYPTEARAHHSREHPHSAEQVEENADRLREYEAMVKEIVAAKATPVRKMLARKSTGAPFVRREETDLGSITTTIESNCGIVGALDQT